MGDTTTSITTQKISYNSEHWEQKEKTGHEAGRIVKKYSGAA